MNEQRLHQRVSVVFCCYAVAKVVGGHFSFAPKNESANPGILLLVVTATASLVVRRTNATSSQWKSFYIMRFSELTMSSATKMLEMIVLENKSPSGSFSRNQCPSSCAKPKSRANRAPSRTADRYSGPYRSSNQSSDSPSLVLKRLSTASCRSS